MRAILIIILGLWAMAAPAQEFRALARVLPSGSLAQDLAGGVEITLALSQPVPFQLRTLDSPRRLMIDLQEVDWTALPADFDGAEAITQIATGRATERPGWSRMVVGLAGPFAIDTAAMTTDAETGLAVITIRLAPTSDAEFAANVDRLDTPMAPILAPVDDRLVIALDPGHGGVDPGAEAGGLREAHVMLSFAQELAEAIIRTGEADVILTRTGDRFVSLPERISTARAGRADVLISLHADALAQGRASGATVYTLSDEASEAATNSLTQQFGRDDLIEGLDLSAVNDEVAGLLLDLNRRSTSARADALADRLVSAMGVSDIPLHSQPRATAGFSVLRAADIPSVLIEIGFLSDEGDRARLQDPDWRARAQTALIHAIFDWAAEDTASAGLRLE